MQLKRLICAMLLSTTVATQAQELKSVSYDDIAQGQFAARGIAGIRSMKDGEHYTTQQGNAVIRHRYSDGAVVDTIFNVETQPLKIQIEGYSMSDDENMMLFPTQREPIYRHSSRSNFYVYDRVKDSLFTLSNNGKQQEATISPNGKYAAFVRENDLWYVDFDKHTEVRITYDGRAGEIINGIPDWVYEEEYSFSRAYQWSPSSDAIAYYRFDERNVKEYNMNYFGQELYPENVTFKYPKAGEENSKVQIKVYRLSSDRHTTINLGSDEDIYIPRIEWTELDDMLAVHRLNRLQNNYDLLLANTISGSAKVIYNEVDPKYIERIDDQKITFLPDGKRFIVKNENDGYMHLYLYDMTGRMINQITRGEWEVIDICGVDNRRSQIYYTSSEISPLQSNLYSINFAGTKKRLLSREGTNHISMSEGCKYYICHNSRLDQPTVATLHKSSGEQVRVLEDNAALVARLKEYALPSKELFSFTTPEGVSLNGYILKPVDFDSTAVYPLMMVQYSGPGSQSVADQWGIGWEYSLLKEGYVVACVDGRGTGRRGEEFRKVTYGNLGGVETLDQISAAEYLGSLSYIDSERIGIYGWSYGGFMALNCILKGNTTFALAVSVAPVTSWRFYDTIYTELYNGLPQQNGSGYDDNSPLNFADLLQGKLFLVHGTADDNVHVQNSYQMIERLLSSGKDFDWMIYPDKNHSMNDRRGYLMRRIIRYVVENL